MVPLPSEPGPERVSAGTRPGGPPWGWMAGDVAKTFFSGFLTLPLCEDGLNILQKGFFLSAPGHGPCPARSAGPLQTVTVLFSAMRGYRRQCLSLPFTSPNP